MPDGEEFYLRPVLRGMCRFESLLDGTLSLEHIAIMNEYLDVQDENEARYRNAVSKK